MSEKAIREIHQLICAGQETYRVITPVGWQDRLLPTGVYKSSPNNPISRRTGKTHAYAPPIDVPAEMSRLIAELRSAAFIRAYPVLPAAWAHYAFAAVHPFADGNGRVARALASVFLYRHPGVPLVIFADQKDAYLDPRSRRRGPPGGVHPLHRTQRRRRRRTPTAGRTRVNLWQLCCCPSDDPPPS